MRCCPLRYGGPYGASGYDDFGVIKPDGNPNNRAAFTGVYAEGAMAPCQMRNSGTISGFIDACSMVGEGQWLRIAGGGRYNISNGIETNAGDNISNNGAWLLAGTRAFTAGVSGIYRTTGSGLYIQGGAGTSTELQVITQAGNTIAYVNTGTTDLHLFTGLILDPTTAPATPTNGQIWYDTALAKFRKRQAGVTTDLSDPGLTRAPDWAPNFTADGSIYIPTDIIMTISQGNAEIGTGTIAYLKSTAATPSTFTSTTLPATLEAGAWLKVTATGVTGFKATQLKRTA